MRRCAHATAKGATAQRLEGAGVRLTASALANIQSSGCGKRGSGGNVVVLNPDSPNDYNRGLATLTLTRNDDGAITAAELKTILMSQDVIGGGHPV